MSAIIWANIKNIYFANTKEEAGKIGFINDVIYDFIKSDNSDKKMLNIIHVEDTKAIKTFEDFQNNNEKIMY